MVLSIFWVKDCLWFQFLPMVVSISPNPISNKIHCCTSKSHLLGSPLLPERRCKQEGKHCAITRNRPHAIVHPPCLRESTIQTES